MSDITTTTDAQTDAPEAPEVVYDPTTATYADDSRVEDAETLLAVLPEWKEATERGVIEHSRLTNAAKRIARLRCIARSTIKRANGFPDWQADTDAYKEAVIAGESVALAKMSKSARKNFGDIVRQHVRRTALLPVVVEWVLTHEANFGDELDAFKADADAVMSNPSDKLKGRVQDHYAAAGLKLEASAFKAGVSAPAKGGPNPDDPKSTLTVLSDAIEGLGTITPRYSVVALLELASALSEKLLAGKMTEIEGRPDVIFTLERVAVIASETALAINPETAGKYDEAALNDALFDKKNDTPQ